LARISPGSKSDEANGEAMSSIFDIDLTVYAEPRIRYRAARLGFYVMQTRGLENRGVPASLSPEFSDFQISCAKLDLHQGFWGLIA
jgi:hypothetical protein